MRKYIIAVVLFAIQGLASAQQVNLSPDHKRIRIGEPITIDIQSSYPKGKNLIWPALKDSLGEHFTILDEGKIDTLSDEVDANIRLSRKVVITSFDSGSLQLPVLRFGFLKGNDTDFVATDPLAFTVLTVPVDTTLAIKDIHGVMDVPFEIGPYLPWILGGLVLLALLIGGIYYLLNRKKSAAPPAPVKQIPAWEIALARLDSIKKEEPWRDGKLKDFYSAITDTIRLYLEQQFKLPALESTSEEILLLCRRANFKPEVITRLDELLNLSDLVKFAKEAPTEASHRRTIEIAYDLVLQTKPAAHPEGKEVTNE